MSPAGQLLSDVLAECDALRTRAEQAESAYAALKRAKTENDDRFMGERDDVRRELETARRQIADLQKQVVRACELRMIADRRAARRNVYGLQDRIRKLEGELVRVWHRASGVELKKLEARLHEQADRIAELEALCRKKQRELNSWIGVEEDEEDEE